MKAVSGWWKEESHSTLLFPLERIFIFSHSLHILRPYYPSEITLRDSWNKSKATSKSGNLMTKNSHQKKLFSSLWWDDDFSYLPTRFHPTRVLMVLSNRRCSIIDAESIHRLLTLTCLKCKIFIGSGDFRFEKANIFKTKSN